MKKKKKSVDDDGEGTVSPSPASLDSYYCVSFESMLQSIEEVRQNQQRDDDDDLDQPQQEDKKRDHRGSRGDRSPAHPPLDPNVDQFSFLSKGVVTTSKIEERNKASKKKKNTARADQTASKEAAALQTPTKQKKKLGRAKEGKPIPKASSTKEKSKDKQVKEAKASLPQVDYIREVCQNTTREVYQNTTREVYQNTRSVSEYAKERRSVEREGAREIQAPTTSTGVETQPQPSVPPPIVHPHLLPTSALLSSTEGFRPQIQTNTPQPTTTTTTMGAKGRRGKSRGGTLTPLEQFQSIRFSLIERNGFLNYTDLFDNLTRNFGQRYRWPSEIQEPVNGMKRILSTIENLIDTSYALHLCLTLHDLQEKMIMTMRDFSEIESFSELKIGRLAKHPRIKRMFGLESVSDLIIDPPELTTAEVMEHIHNFMKRCPRTEEAPTKEEQTSRIHAALDELAQEKGIENTKCLCIFFKAPTFLTFLLNFTGRIRRGAERKFSKNLETYFRTEVEEAFKEESIDAIEACNSFGSRLAEITKMEGDGESSSQSLDIYTAFKGVAALLSEEIESMRKEGLGWKDLLYSKICPILTCAYTKLHPSEFGNMLNVIGSRERGHRTVEETLESCRLSLNDAQNELGGHVTNLLQCLASLESKFWFLLNGNNDSSIVHASFSSYLLQILEDPDAAEDLKIEIRNTFKAFALQEGTSNPEERASAAKEKVVIGGRIKKERGKIVCDHMQSLLNANPCNNLRDLLSLESKLVAERGIADFVELGLGSFVHFCVENQEELSGLPVKSEVITSSSIPEVMNTVGRLLESISSTGRDPRCETESIEAALSHLFAISNASQIGFTSFESLVENAKPIENSDSIDVEFALTFDLQPTGPNSSLSLFDSKTQAEKTAKEGLASAPHLCNLEQWLHWKDLFENYLGDFNSFIKCESNGSDISVINADGKFLKYSKYERDAFEHSLDSGNARMVASCLVGLVVRDGHISVSPLDFYAQTCLRSLGKLQSDKARKLVFACLALAPTVELRVKAFAKVLLSPLIQLVGLESLLKSCATVEEHVILQSCTNAIRTSEMTTSIIDSLTQGWTPTVQAEEVLVRVPIQQNITTTQREDVSSEFAKAGPTSLNVNEKKGQDIVTEESQTFASSESTITQSLCLKIREKFGLNEDETRDDRTSQQLSELHSLAMRSIKRLAADLYSLDTHFVLELVQNCDDNRYSSSVTPTLRIVISDSQLSFDCNEIGFKVADVYALCNVGSSTKKKGMGYIGHKGIGFKSVFKISDQPEIHSKDFHFGFNKSDESGLGYIIPTEKEVPEGWTSVAGGTSIRLPLQNKSESELESIRARVSDIHPSLLLFLRQLSCIKVEDHVKSEVKIMERKVIGDLVELKYSRSAEGGERSAQERRDQKWFVVHKDLRPPAPVARNNIQQTQISMAMPIGILETENLISQQEVYAFLPLRMYGFYFVLQADFELPSSREAVDGSSAWNLWLRDEVPSLFLTLVDKVMAYIKPLYFESQRKEESSDEEKDESEEELEFIQSQEDAIHCLQLLLKMIPLPGQASDFFASTPRQILQSLKSCAFLPSLNCDFCTPLALVLPPENRAARKAVSKYLKTHSIMSPSCSISSELAQALGIRQLNKGGDLLMEILTNIARKWNGVSSEDDFELICWVLAKLDNQASAFMDHLKALRFVPLTDGSSVSVEISKSIIIMEDLQSQPPEACMKNSVILSAAFCKVASSYQGAMSLMRRLGAFQMSGSSFIMEHVIPLMATDDIDHEDLVTCLSYSYMHLKRKPKFSIPGFVRALKTHDIWLVSDESDGADESKVKVSDCSTLHLGEGYGSSAKSDLIPEILKANKSKIFVCLSSKYKMDANGIAREDWRLLFHMLGVRDTFTIVEQETETKDFGKVADFICPDLKRIMNAIVDSSQLPRQDDSLKSVSKNILLHLAKHWDYYSQYTSKRYATHDISKCLPSTWMEQVQNLNWLVGTDSTFHAPSKMFLLNHRSQQVFDGCVAYLDIECKSAVYEALGVRAEVDCEAIIEQLCQWSTLPDFELSKKQMESLYEELSTSDDSQMERLRGLRCIFIPMSRPEIKGVKSSERKPSAKEKIPGAFFLPSECTLQDKSGIIDSARWTVTDEMVQIAASCGLRNFSVYYPYNFKKVRTFLLKIGMLQEPSASHYAKIVKMAALQSPCPDSVAAVFRVFCNWGYQLQISEESSSEEVEVHNGEEEEQCIRPEDILSCLSDVPCFPVKNGEWAPYSDVHFFEDKNLKAQVSRIGSADLSKEALSVCACTRFNGIGGGGDDAIIIKDLERNLQSFYAKINIPSLTDCCTREAKTAGGTELKSENCWFLCVSALVLQSWVCKQVGESLNDTLKAFFQNVQVIQAKELTSIHSISGGNFSLLVCDEKVKSFLDLGKKKLYVSNCNQPDLVSLSEELSSVVAHHTDEALGLKFEKILVRYLELISHTPEFKWSHETFVDILTRQNLIGGSSDEEASHEPWISFQGQPQGKGTSSAVDLSLLYSAASSPLPSSGVVVGDNFAGEIHSLSMDPALAASVKNVRELQQIASSNSTATSQMNLSPGGLDSISTPHIRGSSDEGQSRRRESSSLLNSEELLASESIDECMFKEWDVLDTAGFALPELHSEMGADLKANLQYAGRQGEEIVARVLSEEFKDCHKIEWMNEIVEAGQPYDFVVWLTQEKKVYIEVKATLASNVPAMLPISWRELQVADDYGRDFQLWHVAGVLTATPTVRRLENPARYYGKGLQLFLRA